MSRPYKARKNKRPMVVESDRRYDQSLRKGLKVLIAIPRVWRKKKREAIARKAPIAVS